MSWQPEDMSLPAHQQNDLGPLLICTNLQRNHLIQTDGNLNRQLAKCLTLLEQWRAKKWPIAHLKRVVQMDWVGNASNRTDWIPVFEPNPGELAFEHALPSAYSSGRFAEFMRCVRPSTHFIAGCSLEETILSTVIDGFHRGHLHSIVEDASVSRATPPSSPIFDNATLMAVINSFGRRVQSDGIAERMTDFGHLKGSE